MERLQKIISQAGLASRRAAEKMIEEGRVTVDGRVVKGNANALRRAGLTVTGAGAIQIGPPQGTMLMFR